MEYVFHRKDIQEVFIFAANCSEISQVLSRIVGKEGKNVYVVTDLCNAEMDNTAVKDLKEAATQCVDFDMSFISKISQSSNLDSKFGQCYVEEVLDILESNSNRPSSM